MNNRGYGSKVELVTPIGSDRIQKHFAGRERGGKIRGHPLPYKDVWIVTTFYS